MDFALKNALPEAGEGDEAFFAAIDNRVAQFVEAMDDDLNTADGIAALFEMAREINTYLSEPRLQSRSRVCRQKV